jgi:ketosteroid isomerase-like protein
LEMEKERDEVVRIIETWRTSWERKDVDKYMALYSPDFTASGKNWQQWKEHKARLAKQYHKIKVDVQNLRILQNDGLVLASFVQKYGNEYFSSAGRKTIYLKHSSRWRIVGEYFEGSELKPSIKKEVPAPEEIKPVMAKKEPAIKTEEPKPAVVKKEPIITVEEGAAPCCRGIETGRGQERTSSRRGRASRTQKNGGGMEKSLGAKGSRRLHVLLRFRFPGKRHGFQGVEKTQRETEPEVPLDCRGDQRFEDRADFCCHGDRQLHAKI